MTNKTTENCGNCYHYDLVDGYCKYYPSWAKREIGQWCHEAFKARWTDTGEEKPKNK